MQTEANQEPSSPETAQPQEAEDPSQETAPDSSPEEAPEDLEASQPEAEDEGDKPEGDEGAPPADARPKDGRRRENGSARKARRAERLEMENALLREQLQRISTQPQAPTPPPKAKTPEEQAAEQFRAIVRSEAKALLEEENAQRQQHAKQTEFQSRVAAAEAIHPDFREVVADVANIPTSPALHRALLTSERPGEIMYLLAKNPAELARIGALADPLEAAREVWKLEAKVAAGSTPQNPSPAKRPPAPPSKVGGSASSTRSLEDLPLSDYKRAYRSGRR